MLYLLPRGGKAAVGDHCLYLVGQVKLRRKQNRRAAHGNAVQHYGQPLRKSFARKFYPVQTVETLLDAKANVFPAASAVRALVGQQDVEAARVEKSYAKAKVRRRAAVAVKIEQGGARVRCGIKIAF